jgi:trehalose 6-phosphate phosphatase
LAPIVDDPDRAEMRPRTRELLRLLAKQYSVVVITGRKRIEAMRFLDGIPLLEVVGNHGAEGRQIMPSHIVQRVADWHCELEKRLEALEGVVLEDKIYSLSIHYRQSNDHDVVSKIMSLTESLQGARRVGGKSILNIVPIEAQNKGSTLQGLCQRFQMSRSIFIGDDDTDEDVFALDTPEKILGIRVGITGETAAHYYINDQIDIDPLLEAMAG